MMKIRTKRSSNRLASAVLKATVLQSGRILIDLRGNVNEEFLKSTIAFLPNS